MAGLSASKKAILTTGQVAKVCRVAPRTVSKWFDSGKLKGYRIPGSNDRRIPRENLLEFLRTYGMSTKLLEFEESQIRVLVVTDNPLTAERVRSMNRDEVQYVVHVASNSFQVGAYGAIPQYVVIDFGIGRGESVQLVRSMRDLIGTRKPATRYIAIVGEDDAEPESVISPELFDESHKQPCDVPSIIESIFTVQPV